MAHLELRKTHTHTLLFVLISIWHRGEIGGGMWWDNSYAWVSNVRGLLQAAAGGTKNVRERLRACGKGAAHV